MCRGGPLNKNNYLEIVRTVLGRHASDFSTEKLDLVFRILDSNRDGFLDEVELRRVSQEILNHGCAALPRSERRSFLSHAYRCMCM